MRIKVTTVSKVSKGMGLHKLLKRKMDACEKNSLLKLVAGLHS